MDRYTMELKKYTEEYEGWYLCNKNLSELWGRKFENGILTTKVVGPEAKDGDPAVGWEREDGCHFHEQKN